MVTPTTPLTKPAFRGYFHQIAFFVSLVAGAFLIAKAPTERSLVAACIYIFGLLFLFGTSAVYHRFHWSQKKRELIQRFDHSAIFVLIASTGTPFGLLSLPPHEGRTFLLLIWGVGLIGIIQSILWIHAPKWVMAAECVAMGWLGYPFLFNLQGSLNTVQLALLISGGFIYSLGAVFYATKKPNPWPAHFGYHELFHLCTIIAAALHFTVVYGVIVSSH